MCAQKGGAPSQSAIEEAKNRIADWSSIPGAYQQAAAAAFASKLITGTDSSGTFQGTGSMTRAQAATLLVRLAG